jgi:hypothetical protein
VAPDRESNVLLEGSLISSTYERPGKGKKDPATKITSWLIRADAVRRLDRGEPERGYHFPFQCFGGSSRNAG